MGRYSEKTCEIKNCKDRVSVIRECPCMNLVFVCAEHGKLNRRVRTPHTLCKNKHGKRKLRKAIILPANIKLFTSNKV